MKSSLLLVCLTTAACAAVHADEVATIEFRFPDRTTRSVAIEVFDDAAPEAAANFKKLIRKGYYEGCAVHRAIPGTLVQMGDPFSKSRSRDKVGTGGPGYTLAAEIHRKHVKGAVAAARLGDNVNPQRRNNGSQFYVCLKPQPQLDGKYTVFGQVIQGLDVLELISNKPADTNDYPVERIKIRKTKLVDRSTLPAPTPATKPGAVPPGEGKKPSFWRRLWPF
jgi:cyclophilin family peptidyl-prolyl cis-trans isomerase